MITKANRRQAREAIAQRAEFNNSTGSLRGRNSGFNMVSSGRLNDAERIRFINATLGSMSYVVISYDTPIAWVFNGEWYRVSQRFSQTTSCHSGMIPLSGTKA